MRLLFVCLAGENRSPTAARVAEDLGKKFNRKIEADYFGCGWDTEPRRDYDLVFVMEPYMLDIMERYFNKNKLKCLDILDIYRNGDPELVEILESKLKEFFY